MLGGFVDTFFGSNAIPLVGLLGLVFQRIRDVCITESRIGLVAQQQGSLAVAVTRGKAKQQVGVNGIASA